MRDVDVDWTTFNEFPENTCYCKCGTIYRSHTKMVKVEKLFHVSRNPCPGCGEYMDHLRRVSSDPEVMTIKS